VAAAVNRLSIPTLCVHGTDDRIVPPAASESLDGLPGVTRRTYAGKHELHNEPGGPVVLQDVLSWIRDRVSRIRTPVAG
ncbi:MAG TPA: hypothetical protein VNL94_07820, partial [Candidatus Binatia bacterium]|nr:hypothetical protein [Candidatus Binatia bacterium]